jgi:hypothetical protein
MSNIKLDCHEANHICDKNQYKEAKFLEKVRLIIHLIYCRVCRKYTSKNTKLTKLMNNPKVQTLDASVKDNLQDAFEKELTKQQQ